MVDRQIEEIHAAAISADAGDRRSVRLTGRDSTGRPFSVALDLLHLADVIGDLPTDWIVSDVGPVIISWHPKKDILQIKQPDSLLGE